jgi:hypothetical protein
MYIKVLIVLLCIEATQVVCQTGPCTPFTCMATKYNIETIKSNATQSVNLAYIYSDVGFVDQLSLLEMALMNLNNDLTVLPDIRVDLYL